MRTQRNHGELQEQHNIISLSSASKKINFPNKDLQEASSSNYEKYQPQTPEYVKVLQKKPLKNLNYQILVVNRTYRDSEIQDATQNLES